jgi:DNA repair protein RadC
MYQDKKELLSALYAMEKKQEKVESPEEAVLQFLDYRDKKREYFLTLNLDNQNQIIGRHVISRGTIDQSAVYIQEIIRPVLFDYASGIILGHNHPGGDPEPSSQDIALTNKIKEATQILNLRLLDHIIVARYGHFSFQENGMI